MQRLRASSWTCESEVASEQLDVRERGPFAAGQDPRHAREVAAVILEPHGSPPLVLSSASLDLLDHVIFVYRTRTGWGSVARSRDPGLHGRRPLFATPRALALSYFESYIDFTGRIKAYAVVDLRVMGGYDWRLSDKNVWKVEQMLLDWPHRRITSSDRRADAMRRRYRAFRDAHGYKPWKYYRGRERWTALPEEFARRG